MKKIALCALSIVFAILLCGCTQAFSNVSNGSTSEIQKTKITYIYEDWPYYSSVESLVDYADNVFEGEVINISFAVLDACTGKSDNIKDKDADPFLYTIYEVEITNLYKGENTSNAYIKVAGGVPEYKEDEQLKVMRNSGILDEHIGIIVVEDAAPLNIGDTYFFFTKNGKTKYQNVVNNIQFAYNSEEPEASTEFTYENIKSYVAECGESVQ